MPKQLSEDCHFIVAGEHFIVVVELIVQGQLVIWLPIITRLTIYLYMYFYSLSMQPFANPYCTKEGVVFDLL